MSRKIKRKTTAPIHFDCVGNISLEAADGKGPPSFQMTAYNGGKLRVKNYAHPIVVDLRGISVHGNGDTVPILRDHDNKKPLGHGTVSIGPTELQVTGTLSHTSAEAKGVVEASQNGFPWQASIGGQMSKPRLIAAGKTVHVNGRNHSGPVYVVDSFQWNETSVVAIGADVDRTSITIAAEGETMTEFDKWLEAAGFNADELSQSQEDFFRKTFDAEKNPAKKELEELKASDAAEAAKSETIAFHKTMRKVSSLTERYQKRVPESVIEPLYAQAISGEIDETQYELELLKASRATASPTGHAGASRNMNEDALVAALCQTAGMSEEETGEALKAEVGSNSAEKAMNDAEKLRGFNTHKLCFAVLNAAGVSVPPGSVMDDTLLRSVLKASGDGPTLQASAGFSTISLPGILSRVANKAMLAAYNDTMSVGLQFASQTSTSDFKTFDRFRLTEVGDFEEVGATGEIKSSSLTEEMHQNEVKQYGRIFAITRKMLINDDLDAMLQIPRLLGRMGRRTLEKAIINTLVTASTGAANTNFFYSNSSAKKKPNYFEGADSALDIDSLGTAYELFLGQVDSEGNPVMIEPSYVLVGNKNAIAAGKLFNDASYRFTGTDIKETIDNQWRGRFTPLVSPYIDILGTADEWYLLPAPTDTAVVNVAFLNGQSAPRVEQSDVDFKQLGIQMRGVFDFGVALWDQRLAVKSKGAA